MNQAMGTAPVRGPSRVPLTNQPILCCAFGIVYRLGHPVGTDHMHVSITAVHYHADAIKGVSVLIVPDVDVVSRRLYVSVAAKGAWKYIQDSFLSAWS